jgi:hypothetical protein
VVVLEKHGEGRQSEIGEGGGEGENHAERRGEGGAGEREERTSV